MILKPELLTILPIARQLHKEYHGTEGTFNNQHFLLTQCQLIDNGSGGIIIVPNDTQIGPPILGGLGVNVSVNMYTGSRELVGTFIVVHPEARGGPVFRSLLRGFNEYADYLGITRQVIGTLNALVRPKTMTRFGFIELGRYYERQINGTI